MCITLPYPCNFITVFIAKNVLSGGVIHVRINTSFITVHTFISIEEFVPKSKILSY